METIYEHLGAENLELLVNNFYELVQQDETISPLFKTDIEIVKQKQYMFLTQFLGGPRLYSEQYGHPRMRMRHLPHKIDEKAMMAWLQCMSQAIESLPIEEKLKVTLFNCFPRLAMHMVNT